MKATLHHALPITLLLVLSLGFFYPALFQDKTFYAFDVLQNFPPWESNQSPNNNLISDPVNIFYPAHVLFQQAIQEGVLPFWNHKIFSGITHSPYFGSPIHYLLFSTMSVTSAHDLLLFLHMAGMAIMMFLYLKELHLLTAAALLGAVSWMFNGYLMVWFEFENAPMMALTLPGALLFIERWFKNQTTGNFLGLSIILSLAICAGYAHLLIYQLLLIGVYVIYRYVALNPGLAGIKMKQHVLALSGPAAALMVGLLAGGLFISSHLSLLDAGHREDIPFAQLYESTGKLPGRYLITMIFPDFYGSPTRLYDYINFIPKDEIFAYPYNNYNELCIYSGIVTILLALVGAIYCRRVSTGRFFVVTFITCMAIAMGSIIYWPLAKYLPGLSLSTPTRILYISAFSLAVLAALGLQVMLTRPFRARWPIVLICLVLTIVTLLTALQMQDPIMQRAAIEDWLQAYNIPWSNLSEILAKHYSLTSPVIYQPVIYVILASMLLLGLLYCNNSLRPFILSAIIALMVADQAAFGWNYNSVTKKSDAYPETPGIRFLKDDSSAFRVASMPQYLLNGMWPFGIETVGGYASFLSRRYGELIQLSVNPKETNLSKIHLKQWYDFSSLDSPILSMLNTKYLLAPPGTKVEQSESILLVYQGEMDIYENKLVMPRAYFVPDAVNLSSREEAYRTIANFSLEDFRHTVILETSTPVIRVQEPKTTESNKLKSINPEDPVYQPSSLDEGIISEIKYTTNGISLLANAPQDGFLVVSTNFHPGWRVTLNTADGSTVISPLLANYSLMAVPLKAGPQSISFSFHLKWQMAGITISGITWLCLILVSVIYAAQQHINSIEIRKKVSTI